MGCFRLAFTPALTDVLASWGQHNCCKYNNDILLPYKVYVGNMLTKKSLLIAVKEKCAFDVKASTYWGHDKLLHVNKKWSIAQMI